MCNGEFSSSIRKNREGLPEMEMAYDDAFVAQLSDFIRHASRFVFAGGEPFLIDLYYKIWSAIMDLNSAEIHVVTNGTVLNNKVREVLERGSFHITHSMDSLVEDNFNRIRKNADFDRTMENRSYFMDYCKRKGTMYSMNVCPMQQNWEELPAMIEKCNADQVRLNLLSVFYPPHVSLGYLSKSQLENILVHYSTYSFVEDNEVAAHNVAQFTDLKARLRSWIADKNEQSDHPVAAASMADQFGGSIDTFVDHLKTRLEQYRAQHPEFNDGSYHEMILKLDAIRERCSGFVVSDEKMMEASNMDVEKMVRVLAATSVDALPDQVRSFLEADPSALY
jgi:wyosine [tRNA(Phe)-imidazoG37] synthetase (radical SAM superfamily)